MIKKDCDNKSSNINGVIKEKFQVFLFLYEEILQTQKKHKVQTSDFHSDVFIRLKSIKSKQVTFTHKNTQNVKQALF